jgi:SAM-dependent methyltransferase
MYSKVGSKLKYFFCVICLKLVNGIGSPRSRESFLCKLCQSTPRDRAVAVAVRKIRFRKKMLFQPIKSVVGIADSIVVEKFLKSLFGDVYNNYHFHKPPQIDITDISANAQYYADLVICSDVMEHITPPVEKGFIGLNRILKNKGILVFSVPHTDSSGNHVEHFPVLKEFKIIGTEKPMLVGQDMQGNRFEKADLIFHGGEGEVLEFRVFSENSLLKYFHDNSFDRVKKIKNNYLLGINWEPWSRVWTANKQASSGKKNHKV